MSIEKRLFVRIPSELERHVLDLAKRATAAIARAGKLPFGDRTEAIRFESLHGAIDQLAIAAMGNGEAYEMQPTLSGDEIMGPSVFGPGTDHVGVLTGEVAQWVEAGRVVVELRLPHFSGATRTEGEPGVGPPKPAERWMSSVAEPKAAVRERFEHLLELAVQHGNAAIRPSGISNSVLTEGLRSYTARVDDQVRVDAPVIYRDGSSARPFPLRSLSMSENAPTMTRTLRFALMSVRHVEMDVQVDGAWLRNVKVSQSRAAAFTDEIVFETSLRQFRRLAADGATLIYMHQTGLETAIVGFYRALVHHLLEHPNSICVVPCFFQAKGTFCQGTAWTNR